MKCPFTLLLLLFLTHQTLAQQAGSSLKELLQLAEANYPLLKSKALEVQAAEKNIEASNSSRIPSLDAMYQLNYATHNNISGMFFPQYLLPISGPPSSSNEYSGVFGSAASLLLSWQPLTFGQRQSQVDYAKAGLQYAAADASNEIFKHKIKVVNAYLDVLTASELVKLYEENIRRTDASLSMVRTLVVTGIRPGVDSALLKAEVSKAKVDLLGTKKIREQSLIILSQLLAADNMPALTDSGYFSRLPSPDIDSDTISQEKH